MKILLIGNRTREHLHVPGTSGIQERDGGPVHVAAQTLSAFNDVEVETMSSPEQSWVDLHVEDGGDPTIVTNAPLRVRGLHDAAAFVLLPVAAGEFGFDQLELLSGKIAISAVGLTRVLNSKERHPITIAERFLPMIDILLLPWADRALLPEETLKDLKKHRILILTKGDTGADLYDHGVKHALPTIQGLPVVLSPDQEACFLASFVGHWIRTKESVLSLTFAAEAVATRLRDPEAIPLATRPRRHAMTDPDDAIVDVSVPPLLASTGGEPMHVELPAPLAPGQVPLF